jgi:hypothetical protein
MGGSIAAKKAYRVRHVERGLCRGCPEKATHYLYCEKHWLAAKRHQQKYLRKLGEQRCAEGRCIHCGILLDVDSDGESAVCINCKGTYRPKPERKGRLR